jgi:hypothetical protein
MFMLFGDVVFMGKSSICKCCACQMIWTCFSSQTIVVAQAARGNDVIPALMDGNVTETGKGEASNSQPAENEKLKDA